MHLAESSSFCCGLVVHLLLLPTLPRGSAVTVGYGPESVCPDGTLTHLSVRAYRRTVTVLRTFNPTSTRVYRCYGPTGPKTARRHEAGEKFVFNPPALSLS